MPHMDVAAKVKHAGNGTIGDGEFGDAGKHFEPDRLSTGRI
jgi:hypothetical protein